MTIDDLNVALYLLTEEQWAKFEKKEPLGNILAFEQIGYLINYCKIHNFHVAKEVRVLKPKDEEKADE